MFTPKVRVTGIVFASLLLIASGVWFSSGDSPKAQAAEAKAAKLMDLFKEKLSILQEEASRMTKLYRNEQISLDKVYEANQAVRNAELDMCDTTKERVAVLEKMLAEAKGYEKDITKAVEGGVISSSDAAKAKVGRLDVEIALERAKGK